MPSLGPMRVSANVYWHRTDTTPSAARKRETDFPDNPNFLISIAPPSERPDGRWITAFLTVRRLLYSNDSFHSFSPAEFCSAYQALFIPQPQPDEIATVHASSHPFSYSRPQNSAPELPERRCPVFGSVLIVSPVSHAMLPRWTSRVETTDDSTG